MNINVKSTAYNAHARHDCGTAGHATRRPSCHGNEAAAFASTVVMVTNYAHPRCQCATGMMYEFYEYLCMINVMKLKTRDSIQVKMLVYDLKKNAVKICRRKHTRVVLYKYSYYVILKILSFLRRTFPETR